MESVKQEKRQVVEILIAVSNNVMCEGLRKITNEIPQHEVYCCHSKSARLTPDIMLFDSLQKIQSLRQEYPAAKPIFLDSGLSEQEISCLLVCHNVRGIISPDACVEMFYKAIRVVRGGEIWLDQKYLKTVLRHKGTLAENGDVRSLSHQDKEIIRRITLGEKNREIGDALCLSEHTIKAHVSRIYKRLNVSNRSQLVSLAKVPSVVH